VKHIINALELLVELIPSLELMCQSDTHWDQQEEQKDILGPLSILSLMVDRLQHFLLTLSKFKTAKKDIKM